MTPISEGSAKTVNTKKISDQLPLKHKWNISHESRSLSSAANRSGNCESDEEIFMSATSAELPSIGGTDDLPSLRLSPPIFPTGSLVLPPSASPVKIVKKLPFGYVIGRQPDAPAVPSALARSIKKVKAPMMAARHLRSRSQMVMNQVARALKGTFRRGSCRCSSRHGVGKEGDAANDDQDVIWKKVVLRGLRCRQVEDDSKPAGEE